MQAFHPFVSVKQHLGGGRICPLCLLEDNESKRTRTSIVKNPTFLLCYGDVCTETNCPLFLFIIAMRHTLLYVTKGQEASSLRFPTEKKSP